MPEELIVEHCAPTLAGVKTGNLFNCGYSCKEQLMKQIAEINHRFRNCDLRMTVLSYPKDRALIYLYRPTWLATDLSKEDVISILKERGYPIEDMSACIDVLSQRIQSSGQRAFPHEIGCFLGYPAEDVRGFIEDRKPCKLVGTWKVYGNEEMAKHLFQIYEKCTYAYLEHFEKGMSLEKLVRFV